MLGAALLGSRKKPLLRPPGLFQQTVSPIYLAFHSKPDHAVWRPRAAHILLPRTLLQATVPVSTGVWIFGQLWLMLTGHRINLLLLSPEKCEVPRSPPHWSSTLESLHLLTNTLSKFIRNCTGIWFSSQVTWDWSLDVCPWHAEFSLHPTHILLLYFYGVSRFSDVICPYTQYDFFYFHCALYNKTDKINKI